MKKHNQKFFKELVYEMEERTGAMNTDHPQCPHCGATMNFTGGDLPIGEGHWDCDNCGYNFKEDDLDKAHDWYNNKYL